jgi:hypothetical protein
MHLCEVGFVQQLSENASVEVRLEVKDALAAIFQFNIEGVIL